MPLAWLPAYWRSDQQERASAIVAVQFPGGGGRSGRASGADATVGSVEGFDQLAHRRAHRLDRLGTRQVGPVLFHTTPGSAADRAHGTAPRREQDQQGAAGPGAPRSTGLARRVTHSCASECLVSSARHPRYGLSLPWPLGERTCWRGCGFVTSAPGVTTSSKDGVPLPHNSRHRQPTGSVSPLA